MDILNNIKNIKFINKINKLHFNEIELPFSEYVKQYDSYKLYKIKKHSLSQHFFYNMFSVIFYSIYHTIESNKTERQMFGLLNNCYRLLVTGTDNILDKDNNHYIQHNKLKNSPVIESIIDIKLAEKIISQVLIDYGIKTDNINLDKFTEFQKKIFNTFSIVGYNEAEEIQKKQVYYKPEKILSEVHHIKSGKLFTLPFLIPKLYYSKDKNKINILTELEKGIYSFGIGIQILDDLLDIEEDFSDNKPNYFISLFYEKNNPEQLKQIIEIKQLNLKNKDIEKYYFKSLSEINKNFIIFYKSMNKYYKYFNDKLYNFLVNFIFKKYKIKGLYKCYLNLKTK